MKSQPGALLFLNFLTASITLSSCSSNTDSFISGVILHQYILHPQTVPNHLELLSSSTVKHTISLSCNLVLCSYLFYSFQSVLCPKSSYVFYLANLLKPISHTFFFSLIAIFISSFHHDNIFSISCYSTLLFLLILSGYS